MLIRHSLMQFATLCSREKFTCTFVGTGRNVRYAFLHILPVLQPWWDFPGNYCCRELLLGTHRLSHTNLEERVVAAEVASRRADGPGVIEVQS